ncbi:transposase family protein [Massilimicrobiota sp. SW1139]|uniref:transposase family protein n=1 Tax=Massilimicrobiota sp. SW1139 TaxID=2530043 RepID=UPI00351BBC80
MCPKCGHDSNRYHSTYCRKLQNLPIFGKSVYIYLTGYQYQCENDDCDQSVFLRRFKWFYWTL